MKSHGQKVGIGERLDQLFHFLSSLKVAVVVVLGLAVALATGTILESTHDTQTAQYYVYRALWFHLLLGSLGVNIFAVMVDRWPWKVRHLPFLCAHIGILVLLAGSWITERFGLDGMMRVAEGETASIVELDNHSFVLTEGEQIRRIAVPWQPPTVPFKPILTRDHGVAHDLTIDRFLTHADPNYSFIPAASKTAERPALAAAKIRITGGPMRITQELWLWMGDPSFKTVEMGPARLGIGPEPLEPVKGRPSLSILPGAPGAKAAFSFLAHSSDGKVVQGSVPAGAKDFGIEPGWKGGVKITLLDWVPDALPFTTYQPARIQYGQQAPPSAIHVISGKGGEGSETWLGLGDRAILHTTNGNVEIGYLPQRVVLPFAVRLDRFNVERYEGSFDPASYASNVSVMEASAPLARTISMNEPLTVKGVTLYQASYEDARPRPVVSIFSVNRDPGRTWKYLGSIFIVLGAILLFGAKYRKRRPLPSMAAVAATAVPVSSHAAAAPSEVL